MAGGTAGVDERGLDVPAVRRVIYVMPEDGVIGHAEDEIDLVGLARIVWESKWVVAAITACFTGLAVVYALLATEWYRAEVLLAPASQDALQGLGQLGGLASLAGFGMGDVNTVEAVAVLKSREFAREFIEDNELLTVLLADKWDADAKRWKAEDEEDWPDIRDAVRYFDKKVRSVSEDAMTGLVTLEIEWKDATLAAEWANLLVKRLNDRMRSRALKDAEANVAYLQAELGRTGLVTLQQSIGQLLESEIQKLMLARGNEEFSFRVVDRADPPKRRAWPKRVLVVLLGTMCGGILAVIFVLFRRAWLRGRAPIGVHG